MDASLTVSSTVLGQSEKTDQLESDGIASHVPKGWMAAMLNSLSACLYAT